MRSTVAVAALAVLVLAGCTGTPGPLGPDPRVREQPASSSPGPPPGPRAVGLGGVMVTAPTDWARRSAYLCEGWTGDVVMLPAADNGRDRPGDRCGPVPLPGTSSLTFTTAYSSVGVPGPVWRDLRVGDLDLRVGPGCGRGSVRCTRVVEDPASGVTLVVRMLGQGAAGLQADVPTPNYPHYVTGSAPGAGTVVPLDRPVRVQVGDG